MKRLVFSICVFIILIITSIIMLLTLKGYNKEFTEKIDTAIMYWEKNDKENTLKAVKDINTFWEKYDLIMSYTVTNSEISSISTNIAKLEPLLKENSIQFLAECESIKDAIAALYDEEMPSLHSIF